MCVECVPAQRVDVLQDRACTVPHHSDTQTARHTNTPASCQTRSPPHVFWTNEQRIIRTRKRTNMHCGRKRPTAMRKEKVRGQAGRRGLLLEIVSTHTAKRLGSERDVTFHTSGFNPVVSAPCMFGGDNNEVELARAPRLHRSAVTSFSSNIQTYSLCVCVGRFYLCIFLFVLLLAMCAFSCAIE